LTKLGLDDARYICQQFRPVNPMARFQLNGLILHTVRQHGYTAILSDNVSPPVVVDDDNDDVDDLIRPVPDWQNTLVPPARASSSARPVVAPPVVIDDEDEDDSDLFQTTFGVPVAVVDDAVLDAPLVDAPVVDAEDNGDNIGDLEASVSSAPLVPAVPVVPVPVPAVDSRGFSTKVLVPMAAGGSRLVHKATVISVLSDEFGFKKQSKDRLRRVAGQ